MEWRLLFKCINLKALGLRVQLGHLDGSACILVAPAFNDDFVVLDDYGVHKVGLDFCGCGHAPSHIMQPLHYGWYPATVNQPKTAASFWVLEQFHLLTFKSKASVYEFYYSLAHKTNNMAPYLIKDCYIAFLKMVRQWRHIVMLKWVDQGHDPLWYQHYLSRRVHRLALNQERTSPPIGRLHLQTKGKSPLSFIIQHVCRWLYCLFLGIDANFWLKCKDVSKKSPDMSLNKSWSYFIKKSNYKQHLSEHINQSIQVSLLYILFKYR